MVTIPFLGWSSASRSQLAAVTYIIICNDIPIVYHNVSIECNNPDFFYC